VLPVPVIAEVRLVLIERGQTPLASAQAEQRRKRSRGGSTYERHRARNSLRAHSHDAITGHPPRWEQTTQPTPPGSVQPRRQRVVFALDPAGGGSSAVRAADS